MSADQVEVDSVPRHVVFSVDDGDEGSIRSGERFDVGVEVAGEDEGVRGGVHDISDGPVVV